MNILKETNLKNSTCRLGKVDYHIKELFQLGLGTTTAKVSRFSDDSKQRKGLTTLTAMK